MLVPDHHTTKIGSRDFVFQVNKWPFSITCNPAMPTITESFIDLALVKDMKIPIKKVECRNISYAGYQTKVVGFINQTVQVVYDGVASGTMHLKAKVIRHLTNLYGVDCIAGQKLYKCLTTSETGSDILNKSSASETYSEESTNDDKDEDSADEYIYNTADSIKSSKRKKKNRFSVANISYRSSMMSSPTSTPRDSSTPTSQVQFSKSYLTPSPPGQPVLERCQPGPAPAVQSRQDPSPPLHQPTVPIRLRDLIFCGHLQPCACVDTLRTQQIEILPPHYPVYLPIGHHPCNQDCGSLHVHKDNLHPPNPCICSCSPPRLFQANGPPSHHQAAQVLHAAVQDEPQLPPDFHPCGYSCHYDLCQCLHQYEGRDWNS